MPAVSDPKPASALVLRRTTKLTLASAMVIGGIVFAVASFAPSAFATGSSVTFTAVLNGVAAATSTDARPAQVYASSPAMVRITVHNSGASPVEVATIRLEGAVLNLPLFSYDSTVDLTVPPRKTESLTFPVSTQGIGSQATGLVSATLTAIATNGTALTADTIVTNVHGSLRSIYGLFGLAVLVLTISSLVLALVAMARHNLASNRSLCNPRFRNRARDGPIRVCDRQTESCWSGRGPATHD